MAFLETCPECSQAFTKPAKLAQHLLTHTGERPFSCVTCQKAFRRADHLRRHQSITHPPLHITPLLKCKQCQKEFKLKHQLLRHESSQACAALDDDKSVEDLRCPQCAYLGRTAALLRKHQRRVHRLRVYICPGCAQASPAWSALLDHRRHCADYLRARRDEQHNLYCEQCDWHFDDPPQFRRHQQMHAGRWSCGECLKHLSSTHALRVHIATVHQGLRPYVCPHCSLSFSHKHLLARHLSCLHPLKDMNGVDSASAQSLAIVKEG